MTAPVDRSFNQKGIFNHKSLKAYIYPYIALLLCAHYFLIICNFEGSFLSDSISL